MPRLPRPQFANGIYHLTSRGARGVRVFLDDADRQIFLAILAKVVRRHGWVEYGYCLLGTHYHLLVLTPQPNLALGMKQLNQNYARSFNWRRGGSGHLFESRYHSELVQTDRHLIATFRYMALNPVRAGLCTRPEEWPWSSYAAAVGKAEPLPFVSNDELLRCFDDDPERARSEFRAYVEAPATAAA